MMVCFTIYYCISNNIATVKTVFRMFCTVDAVKCIVLVYPIVSLFYCRIVIIYFGARCRVDGLFCFILFTGKQTEGCKSNHANTIFHKGGFQQERSLYFDIIWAIILYCTRWRLLINTFVALWGSIFSETAAI